MILLDFPTEILHRILFFAIITRRLKRGLRLRLVCKRFSTATIAALFETRLLDHSQPNNSAHSLGPWQISISPFLQNLFHSYLVYRVQNEGSGSGNRLSEIREVANTICKHSGQEISTTIEKLCWLGFERAFDIAGQEKRKTRGLADHERGYLNIDNELASPEPKLNLLSAATYLNLVPLVEQLLADGCDPKEHNYLFPSALETAALSGNLDLVRIFQDHVASHLLESFGELADAEQWLERVGVCAVKGAAIRGDLSFLELVMTPQQSNSPPNIAIGANSIARDSPVGASLYKAQRSTRSPEIHAYLGSYLSTPLREDETFFYHDFTSHCAWGNTAMVTYFLSLGANPNGSGAYQRSTPLCIAAQRSHEDVVEVLLERGADPNFRAGDYAQFTPLPWAAASGSLSMVRKLLDYGAFANEAVSHMGRLPALWYAVATENTAMVRLLESRGASFDVPVYDDPGGRPWIGGNAMEMAEELYLDSMVDLLKVRGVEILDKDRLNNTGSAPWQKWGLMNNPPRNNPYWAKYIAGGYE